MTTQAQLANLPSLAQTLAQFHIRPRQALGQNFLLDMGLLRRIARAGGAHGAVILEIGAGPGGLTRALLLEGAVRVLAIERDKQFAPILQTLAAAAPDRLDVVVDDALTWLRNTPHTLPHGYRVIANLPYNIVSPLLVTWLRRTDWHSLTLLVQKEVGLRITADKQNANYGRLAVLSQWRAHTQLCFTVPARAFTPAPQVDSCVIQLTRRIHPIDVNMADLEHVIQLAFGQRRKMLRRTLAPICTADTLTGLGIAPTARAQDLSVAQFCTLATQYAKLRHT